MSTGDTTSTGFVDSVNVGQRRLVEWAGRMVETGIWKHPVAGRVPVRGVNIDGDQQADLRVHGGPDKAVYAYSSSDYAWWSDQLGRELTPGSFGENLTVSGMVLDHALIGERWRVGHSTVLEVTQPRLPCFKLGMRMGDPEFVERFDDAGRFGVYLRIVEEGTLAAGDPVDIVARPTHDLTAYDLGHAYPRPSARAIERIMDVADVPDGWREWAERVSRRQAKV